MLVSAKEMLTKAKAGKYAVGQFNINNLEWTKSILLTAEELKSPVILGVSDRCRHGKWNARGTRDYGSGSAPSRPRQLRGREGLYRGRIFFHYV